MSQKPSTFDIMMEALKTSAAIYHEYGRKAVIAGHTNTGVADFGRSDRLAAIAADEAVVGMLAQRFDQFSAGTAKE